MKRLRDRDLMQQYDVSWDQSERHRDKDTERDTETKAGYSKVKRLRDRDLMTAS